MEPSCHAAPSAVAALGMLALTVLAQSAIAATFGELTGGSAGAPAQVAPYAAGPYAGTVNTYCPPNCAPAPAPIVGGPEGAPPPGLGPTLYIPPHEAAPRAYLPMGNLGDGPNTQQLLWSFGQINSTTDPYNPWGLSTPYMYVPWSTPFAGWANAATWNWWRERSGALPRNW